MSRPSVEGLESRQLLTTTVVEYPLPVSGRPLESVMQGSDGSFWMTEPVNAGLCEFNPLTQAFTEYHLPAGVGWSPFAITTGPDGNVWFTDYSGAVGVLDVKTHQISEFTFSKHYGLPEAITSGPDGNLWFSISGAGGGIGIIDPATHAFSEIPFAAPGDLSGGGSHGIVAGLDGHMWCAMDSGAIGMIDPATHVITRFPVPSWTESILGMTVAPDGKIWFAEVGDKRLGVLDPITKKITEFPVPNSPSYVAAGSDGGIWFDEELSGAIGRFDPQTHTVEQFSVSHPGSPISDRSGHIWFVDNTNPSALGAVVFSSDTLKLVPLTDISATEGTTIQFTSRATNTSPAGVPTYRLAPGAPADAKIDPKTGLFTWTPTTPGDYPVTVQVADDSVPSLRDSQTFTIHVQDVAPSVTIDPTVTSAPGGGFVSSGSFSNITHGSVTATVDYGDGRGAEPLTVDGSGVFSLTHEYATTGAFVVTVTVKDAFGGVGQTSVTVNSEAYQSGLGRGRDAFVTTLYTETLGHLPTRSDLHSWTRRLALGATPFSVAASMWRRARRELVQTQNLGRRTVPLTAFSHTLRDAWRAGLAARWHKPGNPSNG